MSVNFKNLEWIKISQKFDDTYINNIEDAIDKELDKLNHSIKKGDKIAITAGSRGIDRIPIVLKIISHKVKLLGGAPFFNSS